MDQIYELLAITLGAILANNFIFSQFLGICPFLGVSKKVDTAVGMGIAVTFVMGLASAVCYAVNEFVLVRFCRWRPTGRATPISGTMPCPGSAAGSWRSWIWGTICSTSRR